jgi:hypothetical protein
MSRDNTFWKSHDGIGLVWSNPEADDSVMICKALLKPNFHTLLDIARRFGFDRLTSHWKTLGKQIEARGYAEEMRELERARPIVTRCLQHMEEGLKSR